MSPRVVNNKEGRLELLQTCLLLYIVLSRASPSQLMMLAVSRNPWNFRKSSSYLGLHIMGCLHW